MIDFHLSYKMTQFAKITFYLQLNSFCLIVQKKYIFVIYTIPTKFHPIKTGTELTMISENLRINNLYVLFKRSKTYTDQTGAFHFRQFLNLPTFLFRQFLFFISDIFRRLFSYIILDFFSCPVSVNYFFSKS